MEVRSRILGQTPHYHKKCCGQGLSVAEEIRAVLGKLKSEYRPFGNDGARAKHFIFTNSSTRLHVHVGKANGSFPQRSIRRILSLVVACEQQFDQIHSRDRINGFMFEDGNGLRKHPFPGQSVLDRAIYNKPLSMLFMADADRKRRRDHRKYDDDFVHSGCDLNESDVSYQQSPGENFSIWMARRMANIDSWVLRIRYTADIQDLLNLHRDQEQNSKHCVFNMWNLREYEGQERFDTIEFRQHHGTLRTPVVLNYINLLIRVVVFCHYMEDGEFYPLIEQNGKLRSSDFDLDDFCQAIGCGESTWQYYARQLDDVKSDILRLLNEEQETMTRSSSNDPLVALAVYNIEEERRAVRPRNVRARIRDKLTCGGYGHLSEAYLRNRLHSVVEAEELDELVGRMRISYIEPLNDEPGNPSDEPGVLGWGYDGSPISGDTDPQLGLEHSELHGRIKQALDDMEAGKFVPMLPDNESQCADPKEYGDADISSPGKRKVVDRESSSSSSLRPESVQLRSAPKSRRRRGNAPAYSAGDN